MSLQRSRPADALHRIMSSFKHFEKKIDKLQNDVDYHGQTLNDLRSMVNNLSLNTVYNPEGQSDEMNRPLKKSTAIQYEKRKIGEKPYNMTQRKNSVQPLPNKLKARIGYTEKTEIKSSSPTTPANIQGMSRKRSPRPKKAETPRKANILQNHKVGGKKRSKLTTQ